MGTNCNAFCEQEDSIHLHSCYLPWVVTRGKEVCLNSCLNTLYIPAMSFFQWEVLPSSASLKQETWDFQQSRSYRQLWANWIHLGWIPVLRLAGLRQALLSNNLKIYQHVSHLQTPKILKAHLFLEVQHHFHIFRERITGKDIHNNGTCLARLVQ